MEINTNMDVDKEEFYQKLNDVVNNKKGPNSILLSREKYDFIIDSIKVAKTALKKSPTDYRRLKKYEVVNTADGERLFAAQLPGDSSRLMYVPMNEIYEIIREYHLKLNHGGRSRMMIELRRKFKNITTETVLVFLSLCVSCKNKLVKRGKSDYSSKLDPDETLNGSCDPLVDSSSNMVLDNDSEDLTTNKRCHKYPELYSRGQVDMLAVTTEIGEEYKYLMVYRNFATKFINLKAMKALSVDEAVEGLLEIFLTFGAPNILQSKNGLALIKPICRRVSTVLPDIKLVASSKVFSVNDFAGKSNEDILKKLNEWLVRSQNTKWQDGVKFVQYELNKTFHAVLCRSPHEATFGSTPKLGLTSVMNKNDYEDLITEEDLETVLENREIAEQGIPKRLKLEESLILPSIFVKSEADIDEEDNDGTGDYDD